MSSGPVFIALEGLDGAGTTTQSERLARWMTSRGRRVHRTWEPSGGRLGRLIRELLREDADPTEPSALALLFAADRLDHLEREIRPALARGEDVISDRYRLSSLAYQGVGGNRPWVAQINSRADDPDVTIVLDTPVEVCLERLSGRGGPRDIYERREALEAIATQYAELLAAGRSRRLVRLAGDRPPDAVEHAVRAVVGPLLDPG